MSIFGGEGQTKKEEIDMVKSKKTKKTRAIKTRAIATITPRNSPADMIRVAVSGKADLDKLEKLLTIQERWEANEAKKAYHKAMAEFKANPPQILKDRKVKYSTDKGTVGYSHASLYNVTEKINKELSKHGLSASWTTQHNGQITVTCKITHIKGHSEQTSLSAAPDVSGAKNAIQAIGSTITYLERYTLLALTGLATYGQDDDGMRAMGKPFVKKPQEENAYKKLMEKFAKARKLLGDEDYYRVLGGEGYEHANQITNLAIGEQILRDMEVVYRSKHEKGYFDRKP